VGAFVCDERVQWRGGDHHLGERAADLDDPLEALFAAVPPYDVPELLN
jgi:hypothetical protein